MSININMYSQPQVGYISLGPTCVPAEILKSYGLRTCTFGFDWCRSGSYHLQEFFDLSLDDYLQKHVYHPNIPLTQSVNPMNLASRTSELMAIPTLYGYQYFFNPHRDIRELSTKMYHLRAFERLKNILEDSTVIKIFLIADYVNKEYASFLGQTTNVAKYILQQFSKAEIKNYKLHIARFVLESFNDCPFQFSTTNLRQDCELHTIKIDPSLDEPSVRHHLYRHTAKKIFGANIIYGTLWRAVNK
jgi:hypothetical protein